MPRIIKLEVSYEKRRADKGRCRMTNEIEPIPGSRLKKAILEAVGYSVRAERDGYWKSA